MSELNLFNGAYVELRNGVVRGPILPTIGFVYKWKILGGDNDVDSWTDQGHVYDNEIDDSDIVRVLTPNEVLLHLNSKASPAPSNIDPDIFQRAKDAGLKSVPDYDSFVTAIVQSVLDVVRPTEQAPIKIYEADIDTVELRRVIREILHKEAVPPAAARTISLRLTEGVMDSLVEQKIKNESAPGSSAAPKTEGGQSGSSSAETDRITKIFGERCPIALDLIAIALDEAERRFNQRHKVKRDLRTLQIREIAKLISVEFPKALEIAKFENESATIYPETVKSETPSNLAHAEAQIAKLTMGKEYGQFSIGNKVDPYQGWLIPPAAVAVLQDSQPTFESIANPDFNRLEPSAIEKQSESKYFLRSLDKMHPATLAFLRAMKPDLPLLGALFIDRNKVRAEYGIRGRPETNEQITVELVGADLLIWADDEKVQP